MCLRSCSSPAAPRCSARRRTCGLFTLPVRSTTSRAAATRANRRSSASSRRAPKRCASGASAWTCGTRPSGKRQAVALGGLGFLVALDGRERILVLEERLEARDVALLVGGHLGGEGAHGVGARVGRHVVVEGL